MLKIKWLVLKILAQEWFWQSTAVLAYWCFDWILCIVGGFQMHGVYANTSKTEALAGFLTHSQSKLTNQITILNNNGLLLQYITWQQLNNGNGQKQELEGKTITSITEIEKRQIGHVILNRDCRHCERGMCGHCPVFRPQAQSDPLMTSAGRLTSWNTQVLFI